jgi:hypothetical protein
MFEVNYMLSVYLAVFVRVVVEIVVIVLVLVYADQSEMQRKGLCGCKF